MSDDLLLQHQLLDAAKKFNWDSVWCILRDHPDFVNVQPCGRWSVLHQAAFQPNVPMVRRLIALKADVTLKTSSGEHPIDVVGKHDTSKVQQVAEIVYALLNYRTLSKCGNETEEASPDVAVDTSAASSDITFQ